MSDTVLRTRWATGLVPEPGDARRFVFLAVGLASKVLVDGAVRLEGDVA
ncbi:hypothetical protein [Streptomyces acidiscabies]|nr:hypothetical protein [Streptomyces acidiscabies]